jgi:hypothetical protein
VRELGRQRVANLVAPTLLRAVQRRLGHREHSLVVENLSGRREDSGGRA